MRFCVCVLAGRRRSQLSAPDSTELYSADQKAAVGGSERVRVRNPLRTSVAPSLAQLLQVNSDLGEACFI